MLIGFFNLTVTNKHLEVFLNTFNLENFISKSTFFQSTNLSCIDFILTNQKGLLKTQTF